MTRKIGRQSLHRAARYVLLCRRPQDYDPGGHDTDDDGSRPDAQQQTMTSTLRAEFRHPLLACRRDTLMEFGRRDARLARRANDAYQWDTQSERNAASRDGSAAEYRRISATGH